MFNGINKLILRQQARLEEAIRHMQQEEATAANLLYNHLFGQSSDLLPGFSRYLRYKGEFSGDLVLARRTPAGRLLVLMADATGHSLSSTLTLMPVASIFRQGAEWNRRLPDMVAEINLSLCDQLPEDRFVAAILFELDFAEHNLNVWNGAMPPLLLLNQQGEYAHRFVSSNLALGILETSNLQVESIKLPQQGWLFGFSDGVSEQQNLAGQPWGELALLSCLIPPYQHCFQEVIGQLQLFSGDDDFDDDLSMLLLDIGLMSEQASGWAN